MEWFRHYHGLCSHDQVKLSAVTAGVHQCFAVAAWCYALEFASSQEDRGSIGGLSAKHMAVALGISLDETVRILSAFDEEGLTCDGRIVGWDRRQRRSDASSGRVRAWRSRKPPEQDVARAADEAPASAPSETDSKLDVTLQDPPRNTTPVSHAMCVGTDFFADVTLHGGECNGSLAHARKSLILKTQSLENQIEKKNPRQPQPGATLKRAKAEYPEQFEQLWSTFPLRAEDKTAKADLARLWRKSTQGVDHEEVIAAAKAYRDLQGDYDFRQGLRSWLRNQAFRVRPSPPPSRSPPPPLRDYRERFPDIPG